MKDKIKMIIADDHAVVRTGLQMIFDETNDLELAGEATNGDELLNKLEKMHYDLVILDIAMPGKDALDVMKEINQKYPGLPVVVFTMNKEESFAFRMFKNGASAFLNKECSPDIIKQAIRTVYKGEKFYTGSQAAMLADHIGLNQANGNGKNGSNNYQLTDREFQVMLLIAEGKDMTEISSKLTVSKNTISNHRNQILKKLHLRNNAEIARYAFKNSMVQ